MKFIKHSLKNLEKIHARVLLRRELFNGQFKRAALNTFLTALSELSELSGKADDCICK